MCLQSHLQTYPPTPQKSYPKSRNHIFKKRPKKDLKIAPRGPGGGGGKKIQNIFLINFLAKSDNSKHFSFFHFFQKKINCGHYFCLSSSKIVVTMFACHLHNSSGMCLHLARSNMSEFPAGSEQYFS